MKSNRELLIEAEFNMIENTTKLSSNVKKIIYDENLDIRKEERKKAKENMQAVIIDIKNMAEALKIDINEIFRIRSKSKCNISRLYEEI